MRRGYKRFYGDNEKHASLLLALVLKIVTQSMLNSWYVQENTKLQKILRMEWKAVGCCIMQPNLILGRAVSQENGYVRPAMTSKAQYGRLPPVESKGDDHVLRQVFSQRYSVRIEMNIMAVF